jgi:hypothetical protein
MDGFLEIFFGKRKTPTEILAEIATEARKNERHMAREAKKAQNASLKAFAEVQKWDESNWEFEMKEGPMQASYLVARQNQERAKRYATQAAVLHDFATMLTLAASNAKMSKDTLRSTNIIGRMQALFPNVKQLGQMMQWFELSVSRQEEIQSQLGGAMTDMADKMYENASGELAGGSDSPHDWVRKKMSLHRIEAGLEAEDADELLAKAPKVLPQRGRSLSASAPVGVSSSTPGPRQPPGDDNAGADE